MSALAMDDERLEPVEARCTDCVLVVRLADGRRIVTPLWWYPTLRAATPQARNHIELSPYGVHWPDLDEDLSVEGMLKGWKARDAVRPVKARTLRQSAGDLE